MQAVPFSNRPFLRLALIGALVASLGLAACGRKGPLDPPPAAAATGETPPAQNQDQGMVNPFSPPSSGKKGPDNGAGVSPEGQAVAPKGEKKHIFLDDILN
jgi:predicted small lipoprotein YifL